MQERFVESTFWDKVKKINLTIFDSKNKVMKLPIGKEKQVSKNRQAVISAFLGIVKES